MYCNQGTVKYIQAHKGIAGYNVGLYHQLNISGLSWVLGGCRLSGAVLSLSRRVYDVNLLVGVEDC